MKSNMDKNKRSTIKLNPTLQYIRTSKAPVHKDES